jgi:hypothetical protein
MRLPTLVQQPTTIYDGDIWFEENTITGKKTMLAV